MRAARRRLVLAAASLCAALVTGCASVSSPYGGETSFNCAAKYMEGVPCDSISGTVKNYEAGKLKWQQSAAKPGAASTAAQLKMTAALPPIKGPIQEGRSAGPVLEKKSPREMPVLSAGFPQRTPDRVLRIWVAPYEDEEGALNDQKYVFLTVEKSTWQIEASRRAIQTPFKQIYPLGRSAQPVSEEGSRNAGRSQAQAAITNNPNLKNLAASPQPAFEESQGE